jgi:hypothetical protein
MEVAGYSEQFNIRTTGVRSKLTHYLDGGNIEPGTELVQAHRRNLNQRWVYNRDRLMPLDPKVCVWGKGGNVYIPGTRAVVDTRTPDEFTQEWMLDII